jgi:hypothetical protein
MAADQQTSIGQQNREFWDELCGSWTIPRERLLGNVGRVLGLDLYIHARK